MNPFRSLVLAVASSFALAASISAADYKVPQKNLGFPTYKNAPPGKQMSGPHAAATTPALSPEEAQKKFTLPLGFEIRLFASEPEVVNPVAMTWDERGRLWVVELYEYPLGAKPGARGRDRIKILEDTDGDGRADKVTVFADGFSLATGILLGHGGVFLGQAPHLLFLQDTNAPLLGGAGSFTKANKQTVLLTGFGLEDRHELLNGFTWGPDGQLYMTHGVFTRANVSNPERPGEPAVRMDAAVARYDVRTKKFEVYADGTSNPWGVDFDRAGNAFLSACVIDHMFHMAPGGIYVRQGGQPMFPYAYQLLPSIVDHRHKMAAYAGIQVYLGDQWPAEHYGTIFCGNLHDNAVHQDTLTPNGSTFKSSFKQDFIRANDGWFMPVSQQVGPDGALWVMDWYDKYPCYQNARADPEGVDREHGRIWRVVHTGNEQGKKVPSRPEVSMDFGKLTSAQLVERLAHPNVWQRKMAQRVLSERRDNTVMGLLQKQAFPATAQADAAGSARGPRAESGGPPDSRPTNLSSSPQKKSEERGSQRAAENSLPAAGAPRAVGASLESRLASLWTLHSSGYLADDQLSKAAADKEPTIRMWAARLIGERQLGIASDLAILRKLATDSEPTVRTAVATACRQLTSGSLTVNTKPQREPNAPELAEILAALIAATPNATDLTLNHLVWMAAEPLIAKDPKFAFALLNKVRNAPLAGSLAYKTMRRVCDLQSPAQLDAALDFLGALPATDPLLAFALNGLVDGQKGKALKPAKSTEAVLQPLLASPREDVARFARQLGALWGDAGAMQASLALVNDAKAPLDERLKAAQTARQLKNDAARDALLKAITPGNPEPLVLEAIAGLSQLGAPATTEALFAQWKNFSPAARRAAAETLASRNNWASQLLSELEQKRILASDIPAATIRSLTRSEADYGMLAKRATAVFGRVRDANADKLKLIAAKKDMILGAKGQPDLKAGYEVAKKICFTCHKLHGEGADIGPDLTGVGRSSLDALLANIIDPNQIIGAGYEMVEVETKDGRSLSGRMVENTDTRVRLLSAGPKEDVVAKSDIAKLRVSELSVMAEGLEQMPDADFRNLIAYILNPPGDKAPFSWKNDAGHGAEPPKPAGKKAAAIDHESVALWNPEWRVIAPEFEGTPAKLVEFAGKQNVLLTHPFDREKPAALERELTIPAGQKTTLKFLVASHEKGDWELRVLANGKPLHKQLIARKGTEAWQAVTVDLTPLAGQKVTLRLENAATGWSWEFAHWAAIEVKSVPQLASDVKTSVR
ncbi:MAG: c-type cytochrome [Verrucomicrobia bacterium]|nr:c-type cytochrome [Verrucomicrobiota bacterium]